ncbi:MAG TPA: hypothetical protein VFQ76_17805 [Longimicrobiaceae bacterium]|nr:hypothetical protein [Longimicrobiaceae bacterium]
MKQLAGRLGRGAASAGMLAVLGFGAAQALAAPAEARAEPPVCNTGQCNVSCRATGADSGRCAGDDCACLYVIPTG